MKRALSILIAGLLTFGGMTSCTGGAASPAAEPAADPVEASAPAAAEPAETPAAETTPEPESPAAETPSEEPAASAGELNVAIFEGGYGPDFWNEITKRYQEETGITVNLQISPNIGETIRPQIVAGNVPDFINMAVNDVSGITAAMVKDRALTPLTDVFDGPQYDSDAPLRDKIIPGFLESQMAAPYAGEGDSTIYFGPDAVSPMGFVYNKTLFAEKGWELPVTWDDYFALGELTKAEGIPLQTYQGVHPGYWESILFANLASALGDDYHKIEDVSDPLIWADPRTIAVLEQYEKIYTTGNLMPGTVAMNHTQTQAAQMMNQAVFIPNGTWMEDEMKDAERAPGYAFGLAIPPVLNAGDTRYVTASVGQFSIPAGAKNVDNAKNFLRYLYMDSSVELYAELGGGAMLPTTNALDLIKPYVTEGVYGMQGAFTEPGATALIFSYPVPPENSTVVIKDEIWNPMADVMSGNMTGAEWAANIQQAYQNMYDGK